MKMGTFALQNPHKSWAGKERRDEGTPCLFWKTICSKSSLLPDMLANTRPLVIPFCFFYGGMCGVGVHACAHPGMCMWKSEPLFSFKTRPLAKMVGWRASNLPVSCTAAPELAGEPQICPCPALLPQSWLYRLAAMPGSYMGVACYMHIVWEFLHHL